MICEGEEIVKVRNFAEKLGYKENTEVECQLEDMMWGQGQGFKESIYMSIFAG